MAQVSREGFERNRTYNYVRRTPEQLDAGRHIGEEPRGLLGSAWDNLWGGMEGMVGGLADTAGTMLKAGYEEGRADERGGLLGKWLVDRAIDLNQHAAENARRSGVRNEYSDMGILDRLTSPSYLFDPRGLTAEVSNMTGSMIPFMLMSAAMPEFGAAGAAGLIGRGLSRIGANKIAGLFEPGGAVTGFLRDGFRWAPTGVVDAAANAGEVAEEMRRQGYTDAQIADRIGSAMSYELPYDVGSQVLFGGFLGGKGVRKFAEGGIGRNIAANTALGGLEALNEAGQEFVQTQAVEQALGKPVGTFMNPTDEERKAFDAAFIGTLPMVAAGGARNVTKNWLRGKVESGQSELQSSAPVKTSGNENTDALIAQAAEKYGVPVNLLHSIAQTESGYNQGAKSEAGAIGMMQLMPDTAAGLGVDPNDLAGNIEGGAKYLREMLDTFDGNVEKAVAAYNAGPNAVKQHGGIPPFEETRDYVSKVLGGLDGYDTSVPQRMRNLADDAAPYIGVTMDNGTQGCVEAVTKIGAKSCPFLAQELSNGVVNVDRLVADAGNNVIPFDPNQLEEGDVIVYGDESDPQRHVVLYDGKGGYIGNSTEQNKVVQGSDYNAMGNWTPTKIIKTGAQFVGGSSARPVMPDFTGLIADETNIKETQEAIQKLIDTDTMTPEQHVAILQAAEMARDTPIGSGTDPAAEAESVNEWQRLIDRKDAKGIFEKDPKRIVQHLQRLEKTQKVQRTRAAIENQQQIEATKQALQAVQQAQNAQAVPTQGDVSVQQIVPEQIAQPMMDGQVSPTIQQAGDMQGANAAQMSAPIQPENVMQNPQMVQGTDGQIAPQNIPVQNMFDAPVPQNAVNSAVPTPSEALAAEIGQGTADAQPMPQPMETQANIDDVQQAILQREMPLLSVPAYVQARQSGDLNTAAQIAQQVGANDVAQLYGMLLAHRDGQAANVTPYAPQQDTPQAAVPVKAPVPVVGVRPNVPTKLPDNLEERRKLGRALGRFMLANNFNIAPQLRDDLSMGRGNAIRKADEKITAWEEKRAAEEQSAVENGSVNAPQTAQADAQSIQNAPQDRILAQRGESAQNGSKTVRGKSVQNQGEQLSPKNAAKKKLREIQGQEIINKETGIPAILNAKGINKMLSNAAVAKSQKNGYTQAQHLAAAENIKELYENATLTAADKKGDSNIASIKRFSVDTVVDNEKAHAKITVKESVLHGHRIYSVELEALEKPVEQVKRTDIVSSTGSENPSLKGSKVSADYADGRSSTSTIPSEAEESKEKPLNEDEREAVKGLSADAKNVYQMVRDKLSGMKNEKVARAASAGAVLLARHADIIARKVRATIGTPFTAMDYYTAWVDLQYGGNADGFAQALNAGVNLDEQVPIVDITAALPQKKMSNKDALNFLRGLAQHGNTITSADGKAVFGIDKHVRHITFSSRKGLSDDESKVRQASIRSLDDLLKHAVLVESVPNRKTSKKPAAIAYHRFYVPVSLNGKIATIRIVGEERGDVITFSPTNVHLYDVIVEKRSSRPPQGISPFGGSTRASDTISIRDTRVSVNTEKAARTPAGISPVMGSANGLSTISIRDMLTGVKDADGNVYAQSAWHGSPYDFREFLLSMIGVGEGAQAHGWGLYFAQNRKVSERYKERLTQHGHKTLYTMTYDGKPVEEQSPSIQRAMHELSGTVHSMHGDGVADTVSAYRNGHEKDLRLWQKHLEEFDRAIALYEGNSKVSLRTLRDSVPKYSNAGATIDSAEASTSGKRRTAEDAVRALKEKRKLYVARVKEEEQAIRDLDAIDADKIRIEVQAPVGKLFEVEIPDDDVLIDEQKPFDEQSKFVQEKLEEMFHKVERETLLLALAKQDVRFDEVHGDYCDLLDMEETLAHTENPSAWQQEEVEELRGRVNRELERLLQGDSFERALLRSFRSGREIYHEVRKMFAPHRLDKEASLALNEVGIKGITYDGQRDGRCYVIFDDKAISIIEKFNQQMNAIVKGTTQDVRDGQRIVSLFEEADESTFLHEMGHLFLLDLERMADMSPTSVEELQTVKKWVAWSEGQAEEYKDTPFAAEFAYLDARIRAALNKGDEKKAEKLKRQWEHERFARGFEMYLKHGESPTKGLRAVFAKFRAFLQRVYQAFTGTGGRATAEVEAVMARMISIEDSSDLSAYPQGKKTAVYTDSGKKISVQYRVVSADDLIASHDAGALEINPGYPVALQPRDRERLIMREQVTRMANTLRPKDLADGRNLNQGAPLIRNDGIVLNGNGRIIAIQRAQARNKERATAYRDYLVENAATFGFSKEEVESVKNPVLVREVQGDISDGLMQDIIGSTTGGARMGASEAAQQDAGKITYAMLDTYVPNDKGDLTTAANRSFVAGILHKLVGKDEMNAYLDKDGHVNADGIQRVKRALFALAYGDDELIAKMAESTDDDIRNVSNGLMSAAPMVARLSVKKGAPYVKELQDAIGASVKQLDTLRRSGESVKDYLGAQALFSEHEDSAEMRAILSFLDENKRSGKRIATYFSNVAKTLDEMETPSGNELFDAEMPSLMDVLEGAQKYAENGGQEGLFGDNAQEVTEIKTALVNLARAAWSDKKAQGKVSFKPSQKLRDKVREFFGHDIDEVFITADDMRHIKNAHSDGEEKRGQVNLTPDDIAEVYHVVNEFDSATKERDDRHGNQNILVVKDSDGRMFALLVERGKSKAEVKTVYKYKKPSPMSDAISPNLNARSDSAKVSSTSNISPNEAEGKTKEPTLEELLQRDHSLKKSALEYGAREKDGKVVFADKAEEKDFLRAANALISDVLAKFSVAWHGSPFYFDSFSLGAINSGEGAQAHGYGLYFARNRETAESYRGDLSGNEDIIHYYGESYENTSDGWMITDGNEAGNTIESDDPLAKAFDAMASNHGDVAEAIKDLESELDDRKEELGEDEDFESDEEYNQLRDAIDILKDDSDDIVVGDPGRLFKVEIPDENVMLDEDLGYDEQPTKVKRALQKLIKSVDAEFLEDVDDVSRLGEQYVRTKLRKMLEATDGKRIYGSLSDIVGGQEEASKLLNKYGIKGITYDGQRDGRCYVVFDDNAIDVLETFSARQQDGIKKMLKEISLISPKRLTSRQKAIFGWGKEMGVPVVFFKGDTRLHGFHSTNGVTFLNANSEITPQWTFWHEAMHWMKANNPDIYNDLVRAVSGADGFTKKQLDAYRREIGAPRMSDSDVIEEMLADALPDVKRRVPLLRDVGKRDKNVVQRLVAWIHDVMRRFHDYFRAPHAGLTSDQRLAMVKAFGNLVGSLRDADGKLIFRVQNEGARITLRDGKPLPTVKYSLDNTGKVGDNEGGRNLGEARKEAICSNVLARMKTRVHEMLKQGVSFAEIQKELEDENSTSREEALRVFKTQWNIFNSPRVNKRNIVERITKREDFTDDEVNELFEQYKATMKEMLDYGGFIYKEAAFQQRGNREFLAGVHSWRDLERANARHGGSAHTGHKNSLNTKHLESQGAFSTPKFSANTQESRKGNFKWLTGAIRSFVGVAPADNLELPGRPTREQILSPKELERRVKERWIQEKNIISQEKQPDGKIKVTYYPDTHDVGYADWVKSVRQVAKRNPFVQALYKRAHAAMKKQEHLRNEFGKVLKTFADLVKNPEDLETVSTILWLGDAKGKVYTDAELRSMGASENAIKAYKLVREVLERAYKILNDARMQVQTRSQTMAAESVEVFKKNHWIKDGDVISVEKHRDGQVLLTWRGGKTYETKDKMITTEALELLQKDDDIIVTRATPLSPTQYGEGMYEVDYVERIKPIHRLTGYMPHFFHEWMVYEKYQDPNTGQTRYTTIGSGRTMNEAVKIGNEIAAKNKDKQYVLRPKGFDLSAENSVVIGDMDFAQMTKKLAENTEMTLTDARAFLQEDVGVSLKSRHRFLGNAMKRKGAEGFDEDVMWVLAHYLNSTARYVAMEEFKPWAISMYERFFGAFDAEPKNLTAKYCKDFINDVNGNPRGVEVWLNDLIKKTWLGKHVADSYGDRVALAINGELSTWNAITKLGLCNFASAAVNFSQFINVGAALNDYGYAMKGLKKALNPSALDEKIIEASGLLDDINMADDNGGYTQRRGGKVRGIYSAVKKGGEWTLIPFQKADTLMRKAAVLGAYYQGVEQKGMKTAPGDELSAEALDYAQEINDDANFDYSSANAPNMLRAGSVVTQQLFQFQKYPIMQFEFMYNILKNGTRGQKVRMFVPYVLFCGIGASIPFGSLFNQLFSFLLGLATGDDEDIAQEVKAEVLRWAGKDPVKKAIAETALYGVLAPTFGLDISGRIGMSNAFAGEFYGEKPDSISGIAGQQLGGPMAVSAINMLRQAHEGNPIEALKALSPALGNMAQAWAGESRTTRHRVNTRYDTAYDKIAHALGFRSVDESNNAFIMNYEYEQKSKLNRTKQEAIQEYIDAPSDANRRTINALGITERQIKEARIQQERTALERATEGRPNTSRKHRASQRRKEEAKRETLYDTLDDE